MRILVILSLTFLSSCAIFKGKKQKVVVKGIIEIHKPYCGGAKPTEEMSKGTKEAYSNATFYVKSAMNNDSKKETVLTFTTDEKGNYSIKLKKGSYFVIHEDKVLSFEKYVEKNKQTNNKFLEYIGDKDAKKEYEHVDFLLNIQENKEFNYAYKTKCFSGLNMLLKYVGPLPQ